MALKDQDLRQDAYLDYCNHRAQGHSKRSWRYRGVYKGKLVGCTWETMEKYMRDEGEFDPAFMKMAECDGLYKWEKNVADAALGVNKNANIAGIQMIMRNMFYWDRPDVRGDSEMADAMTHFSNLTTFLKNNAGTQPSESSTGSLEDHTD